MWHSQQGTEETLFGIFERIWNMAWWIWGLFEYQASWRGTSNKDSSRMPKTAYKLSFSDRK